VTAFVSVQIRLVTPNSTGRLCVGIPIPSGKAVTPSQVLIIKDLVRHICRHKPLPMPSQRKERPCAKRALGSREQVPGTFGQVWGRRVLT
jgi:hypothetical protein